jgi:hypothetical protein
MKLLNIKDYHVRYTRDLQWYLKNDQGMWIHVVRSAVKKYLSVKYNITSKDKLEDVMLQICMDFCVDYAGPDAERVALNYSCDLGASPEEATHLKAGDHDLPCGYLDSHYARYQHAGARHMNCGCCTSKAFIAQLSSSFGQTKSLFVRAMREQLQWEGLEPAVRRNDRTRLMFARGIESLRKSSKRTTHLHSTDHHPSAWRRRGSPRPWCVNGLPRRVPLSQKLPRCP